MDIEHDMQGRVQSPYPTNSPEDILFQSANRASRENTAHQKKAADYRALMEKHLELARQFGAERKRYIDAIEDLKRIKAIDKAEAEARRLAEEKAKAEREAQECAKREAERAREWLEVEQPRLVAALDDYNYGGVMGRTGTDG